MKKQEGLVMDKWTRALYQPGLPLGENGERLTGSKRHIELSKEAAKEGMVLLKNRKKTIRIINALPPPPAVANSPLRKPVS